MTRRTIETLAREHEEGQQVGGLEGDIGRFVVADLYDYRSYEQQVDDIYSPLIAPNSRLIGSYPSTDQSV